MSEQCSNCKYSRLICNKEKLGYVGCIRFDLNEGEKKIDKFLTDIDLESQGDVYSGWIYMYLRPEHKRDDFDHYDAGLIANNRLILRSDSKCKYYTPRSG